MLAFFFVKIRFRLWPLSSGGGGYWAGPLKKDGRFYGVMVRSKIPVIGAIGPIRDTIKSLAAATRIEEEKNT